MYLHRCCNRYQENLLSILPKRTMPKDLDVALACRTPLPKLSSHPSSYGFKLIFEAISLSLSRGEWKGALAWHDLAMALK